MKVPPEEKLRRRRFKRTQKVKSASENDDHCRINVKFVFSFCVNRVSRGIDRVGSGYLCAAAGVTLEASQTLPV